MSKVVSTIDALGVSDFDQLESESIHILREVHAECKNPALLFSGGKDSAVLLRLAEKAFWPDQIPFHILHIDTGHNFPEVLEFRDQRVRELGQNLLVRSVADSISRGSVTIADPVSGSRNEAQSVTLLESIRELGLDACLGGARRDEEKSRAKERIFSFRDSTGNWNPKNQRPEVWSLYNTQISKGENIRVFPLSNWTELDIWQYIQSEDLKLPSIYFSHEREIIERNTLLVPVTSLTPPRAGETVIKRKVRFRTVGDITCTCPVLSEARTVREVILETQKSVLSERGATRMDDLTSDASMEIRKMQGYF